MQVLEINRTSSSEARGLGGSAIMYARTPDIAYSLVNNLSPKGNRVDCDNNSGAKALRYRVKKHISFYFTIMQVLYIGHVRMFFERFSFSRRVYNGYDTYARANPGVSAKSFINQYIKIFV